MTDRSKSLEHALEQAVSRALRDNLAPLQRTADELHQAYADLVAACSSSRPSNALPAMLRAQTAASALAAGLSVLSNFVAVALNPRDRDFVDEHAAAATAIAEPELEAEAALETEPEIETQTHEPAPAETAVHAAPVEAAWSQEQEALAEAAVEEAAAQEMAVAESTAFDLAALPDDLRDLHRRASRNAKVAMQDIQLLRPEEVKLGRENHDLCQRLRSDLDKARKEYDRRFRAIQDHPVDYFHHWMVEILAKGKNDALGEYPYPSPVLRP
ncbi:MAG TPA: hypothetical protein VMD77_11940 [Candidatus Baltobacteraceae bacterium]|nr:hypothetical protein [Candidatus Baltobacteraceae bacterium]